jgi:hypothetical protein
MHDNDRNAAIRKLAETYQPNLESLADKLAAGPLADMFADDPYWQSKKLSDEAIARMMQK